MVQSYICYVNKPMIEVELSKFSDFSLILSANVRGGRSQAKGQRFWQFRTRLKRKMGTVALEADSDGASVSSPTRRLETADQRLLPWKLWIVSYETVLPLLWLQSLVLASGPWFQAFEHWRVWCILLPERLWACWLLNWFTDDFPPLNFILCRICKRGWFPLISSQLFEADEAFFS